MLLLVFTFLVALCSNVDTIFSRGPGVKRKGNRTNHNFRDQGINREGLQNRKNQRTASNYGKTCLYVWTRIDGEMWHTEYLRKFTQYMDDVFFGSIRRQCTQSPCLLSEQKVFIRLYGEQGAWVEEFLAFTKQLENVIVYGVGIGKGNQVMKRLVLEMVTAQDCGWVANIWIDADDAMMDGYFQYITMEIPNLLLHTTTAKGDAWRGAILIPRELPRLLLGNNRCTSTHIEAYMSQEPFFCGMSPGRTLILRRDVWDSLEKKIFYPEGHVMFVKRAREFVMHNIGNEEYSSLTCTQGYFWWKNIPRQIAYGATDTAESRLLLIDVTEKWKTSGMLMSTPFSSHFPWEAFDELPVCTKKQMSNVQKIFPKDIGHLLHLAKNLQISMEEACDNNYYLAQKVRKYLPNVTRDRPGCESLDN